MGDAQATTENRLVRLRQWLLRVRSGGHEQDMVLLVLKGTLAATLAWWIAHSLLHASSPAFAPFAAVWMMRATVYRSLVDSLQYTAAAVAGVGMQGVLGFLTGGGVVTFAVVALLALAIAQWPRLGAQGTQVATAAFFAFSVYVATRTPGERLEQLGTLAVLVLLGCAVGTLVNLLVMPPMRYRGAEYGLRTLARELHRLLEDMHPALCRGTLDREHTSSWEGLAAELGPVVDQARASARSARESLVYNPRRLLPRYRRRPSGFSGYDTVLRALERVSHQLTSLVHSLHHWHDADDGADHSRFLRRYGDFLATLAGTAELLVELDEDRLHEQTDRLRELTHASREAFDRVAEAAEESPLPITDTSRPYGVLLVEAVRLTEEFEYTRDVLRETA
ncbi:aromatic acid exporter family protein, partial [Streptomyces sp. JJ36]|uniref:FUSC family protein n=1 Tax=Streptomyces sp. JJ36 TaxID=2736645 RepID=UPI001F39E88A